MFLFTINKVNRTLSVFNWSSADSNSTRSTEIFRTLHMLQIVTGCQLVHFFLSQKIIRVRCRLQLLKGDVFSCRDMLMVSVTNVWHDWIVSVNILSLGLSLPHNQTSLRKKRITYLAIVLVVQRVIGGSRFCTMLQSLLFGLKTHNTIFWVQVLIN